MKRRMFMSALCLLALLAVTACSRPASGGLTVDDVREIRYWRLSASDQTQTATPEQIRLFVDAYNAAKPVPGDYGTTPPVRITVTLKSGEEIRLDGGGQSYSTRYDGDATQILEGAALHEYLKGLAGEPPEHEEIASAGWSVVAVEQWIATQYRFDSAAEARGSLTFTLRSPDPSLVPSPIAVYVGKGAKSTRMATVLFGDPGAGLFLNAIRSKTKSDPAGEVQRFNAERASGVSTADQDWQLVTVGGLKGRGVEPGINDGPRVPARHRLRPGVVSWFDDGVHYVLYGTEGPQGTPLSELLTIADSMY